MSTTPFPAVKCQLGSSKAFPPFVTESPPYNVAAPLVSGDAKVWCHGLQEAKAQYGISRNDCLMFSDGGTLIAYRREFRRCHWAPRLGGGGKSDTLPMQASRGSLR